MSTALAPRPSVALTPEGERFTWLDILRETMSNGQREVLMRNGVAPHFEDLVGWEFGGGNTPPIFRLIGIRKFVKGFYEGPARAATGPRAVHPGLQRRRPQQRRRRAALDAAGDGQPQALRLLPRAPGGRGGARRPLPERAPARLRRSAGNGLFGPPLRDYLVQVYPDDPDLLLGKAYLNVLGLRIPTQLLRPQAPAPARLTTG